MEERRKFVRLDSRLQISYREIGAEQAIASLTKNVSEGGVSMFTTEHFALGTVLQIDVTLPNRKPITFTSEVAWCGPLTLDQTGQLPRMYETGLRFRDISAEDRKLMMLHAVLTPPPSGT